MWQGYITIGTKPNGKLNRLHRTGATYEECADKILAIEDELAHKEKPKPRHASKMDAYLIGWLTEGETGNRGKYMTLRDYRLCVHNYLIPHLGGHRIDELDIDHVTHMKAEVTRIVSAHAAAKALRVLRSALSDAMREGLLHRNVAKLVKAPTIEEEEVEALTLDEVRAILAEIRTRRNRARWLVAVSMGQRQGECLALAWRRPHSPASSVTSTWTPPP